MSTAIQKEDILNLDSIAQKALSTLGVSGSFEETFAVADAMMQLRTAITPAMMERFLSLQNSRLGFMTDKNPKVWNKKENAYNKPYGPDVVRDCVIEATLRGVRTIGNQFNIIAANCYITKEGFEAKLKKIPHFAEFKPSFSVPKIAAGGAIVECEATWTLNGKPDSMKATIACKGDDYAGSDSYIGKAQRKFYKRVFERLTGTSDPDGEADVELAAISDRAPGQISAAPRFAPATTTAAAVQTAPTDEEAEAKAGLAPARGAAPKAAPVQPELAPDADAAPETIQGQLGQFMGDAGVTFDKFRRWAGETERLENADSYSSWEDLPAAFCEALKKDTRSINKCVIRCTS